MKRRVLSHVLDESGNVLCGARPRVLHHGGPVGPNICFRCKRIARKRWPEWFKEIGKTWAMLRRTA